MLLYYSNLTSNKILPEDAAGRVHPLEAPLEILSVIRCPYHTCTLHGIDVGDTWHQLQWCYAVNAWHMLFSQYLQETCLNMVRWSDLHWETNGQPQWLPETILVLACTGMGCVTGITSVTHIPIPMWVWVWIPAHCGHNSLKSADWSWTYHELWLNGISIILTRLGKISLHHLSQTGLYMFILVFLVRSERSMWTYAVLAPHRVSGMSDTSVYICF